MDYQNNNGIKSTIGALLCVIALLVSCDGGNGGSGTDDGTWAKQYTQNDYSIHVNPVNHASDGGIIGVADRRTIVRFDKSGNPVWQKSCSMLFDFNLYDAQETSDGGIIASGYYWSSDCLLLKLDAGGNLIRSVSIGKSGELSLYRMIYNKDRDSVVIFGSKRNPDGLWIIKLDGDLNVLWGRLAVNASVCVQDARNTADGGVIMAGHYSVETGGKNIQSGFASKISADGAVQWEKRHELGGSDAELGNGTGFYCTAIDEMRDGGYMMAGIIDRYDKNHDELFEHACIMKLDRSGNKIMAGELEDILGVAARDPLHVMGLITGDQALTIRSTSDGGCAIMGLAYYEFTMALGELVESYKEYLAGWIMKLTPSGKIEWQKKYSNKSQTETSDNSVVVANSLLLEFFDMTPDGGYILAGEMDREDFSSSGVILRTDDKGNISDTSVKITKASARIRNIDIRFMGGGFALSELAGVTSTDETAIMTDVTPLFTATDIY
jgi:hypothetical protein